MPSKFLNLSTDTALGGNAPSDYIAPSQKAVKTYVDNHGGGGSVAIDNNTITKNASDQIQAVAVIDQNTGIAKTWTGTQAEYEAIVTKDPETEYIITDDIGDSATVIGEITEDVNELNAHKVVEFQEPTAENGYTWYRKYADGWVEQGGFESVNEVSTTTITLPVTMADTNYIALAQNNTLSTAGDAENGVGIEKTSVTQVTLFTHYINPNTISASWEVKGMAA